MSSSDDDDEPYSGPLADLLVGACWYGELRSAKAAVADGADVNEEGTASSWLGLLPLAAAVRKKRDDVVVWLLSHGADPNGDKVLYHALQYSTVAILQLLIDAGGDVNREVGGWQQLPLFLAVESFRSEDYVRVLLAQPSLDFTIKSYDGDTPEQYARALDEPALAGMIAQEVSGKGLPTLRERCADVAWRSLWLIDRSREEVRWYDHSLFATSQMCL